MATGGNHNCWTIALPEKVYEKVCSKYTEGKKLHVEGRGEQTSLCYGKWRCFVENVFPGIDNVLIDQFAVVYFCVSGEEKLLVVCYEDISCTKTAQWQLLFHFLLQILVFEKEFENIRYKIS